MATDIESSWRAHLFSLAGLPEGYDAAPLLAEISSGSRPLFTVMDPDAVARAATDPDIAAAVKSCGADPIPAELIAKALAIKLAENKVAGIEAKAAAQAAAAAAAAEIAAAKAAAEEAGEEYAPPEPETKDAEPEEGEEPGVVDEPPPVEKAADSYVLLQSFPRSVEDAAALAAEGISIDTLIAFEMDSECLRVCQGAEPPPCEEGMEPEPPHALEAPPLLTALQAALGGDGTGLDNCVLMTVGGLEPSAWATPTAVFSKLSSLLYASAQKVAMFEDFHLTLSPTITVPTPTAAPDLSHFHRLLAAAPQHALGVPYVLHCLVEQVVRSNTPEDEAAIADADAEFDEMSSFFSSTLSMATSAPKSALQQAAEAADVATDKAALMPTGDRICSRQHLPAPFGIAPSGVSGLAPFNAERAVLATLSYSGKARKGMPAEDATLTEEERGAERTELHHFSQFAPPQVDAAMQLRALASLCNANDPHRGGATPKWVLADRLWLEEHAHDTFVQVMLDVSASSAPPKALATYHARDDVVLVAYHRPVPPERVCPHTYRLPVVDLVERKYGAWHTWLMKGQPDEVVPPPPPPPTVYNVNEERTTSASLYKMDEAAADRLDTATDLFPSDHALVRCGLSSEGHTTALFFRDGAYAALRKLLTADTCELALTFEDGARAAVDAPVEGGAYALAYGSLDGVQVSLDVLGVTRMMPPAPTEPEAPKPTKAATLTISELSATALPPATTEGGELYLRVALLDPTLPPGVEVAASSPAMGAEACEGVCTFGEATLTLQLPAGSSRPLQLLVQLWDSDHTAGGEPLASVELGADALPEAMSGVVEGVTLAPAQEGAEPSALALRLEFSETEPLTPEPPPREVARTVLASGAVVCEYADGAVRTMLRDGNLCERAATGALAQVWVVTNSLGLRAGTTDAGESLVVAPVPVASSTDPLTHHVMTTRADGTVVVARADGSRLVQFADGTTIDSSAEVVQSGARGEVRVNCEGYPPVRVNLSQMEAEVSALDGTMLKAELAQPPSLGGVTLNHLDGTVLTLQSDGAGQLFPASLAWADGIESKAGVYHLDLVAGTVFTKDPAGSTFRAGPGVESGYELELAKSDELAATLDDSAKDDAAPSDDETPEFSHPPRVFAVRSDGSGVEFLRAADVRGFVQQREAEIEGGTAMLLREPLPSEPSAEVCTYVWRDWMQMHIASLEAERRDSDAVKLLGFQPKVVVSPSETTLLRFRRLLRRDTLSEAQREALEAEIASMASYREQEEAKAHELHVTDLRTEEEKAAEAEVAREMLKAANQPSHLSTDMTATLASQYAYSTQAFQDAGHARSYEAALEEQEAAEEEAAAALAAQLQAEAQKFRKDTKAPSLHGGYEERKLRMVPMGGELLFGRSATNLSVGEAPPLPPPKQPAVDSATDEPRPTGSAGRDDVASAAPADASALLVDARDSPRPTLPPLQPSAANGAATAMSGYGEPSPQLLPPQSVRMSNRVPPRVDGSERMGRVGAPVVSQLPASANPNLMNLLLEVPYKRGVHTVSVNQRYLNHEPTFDAAFELLPARVDFGTLGVNGVYRCALKLANVSNLSQRFSIKHNLRARVIYTPGAVAAGMAAPIEVEVCETAPTEIREVLTIVTEREEISLPVFATVGSHPAGEEGPLKGGVRLLSTKPRDPLLGRTVAPTVNDLDGGTKRFVWQGSNRDFTPPDFFGEPPSDDDDGAPA